MRNLADPIKVDPADPMAQLAVVLLALFAQRERTYMLEWAVHPRAVATANDRRVGGMARRGQRHQLQYAEHPRQAGQTISQVVAKPGITRTSLYRHLPARPAEPVTVAGPVPGDRPGSERELHGTGEGGAYG